MSNVVYKDTGLLFLRDNNAEATTLLQKFATKQAEKKVLLKKKRCLLKWLAGNTGFIFALYSGL